MTSEKYIGLDVHQATISVAVMDASGKLVMESIVETKASTLLQFIAGLRGMLSKQIVYVMARQVRARRRTTGLEEHVTPVIGKADC